MTYGDEYAAQLWGSPASEYLRRRGLLHSTIQRFNLGFVGKPATGAHARYRGRVSIPYTDGLGRERGIRYRSLGPTDERYKYLAPKNFSHLFAVRASDHPVVFITEGEIDAMTLWQLGYRAVGVPGAQVWKDHFKYLFRNVDEAVICFDFDEPKRGPDGRTVNPGQVAAAKIYRSLESAGIVTRAVTLPRGSDVNDCYLELGEKGLRELLEAA